MNAVTLPLPDQAHTVRRATPDDMPRLARLFAAVFASDPVFSWLTRAGLSRHAALERFFLRILKSRTLPHGETWLTANGLAAAAWVPPYSPLSSPSLLDDLRMLPTILRLTGLARLPRGAAMSAAMATAHPDEPCFYLAFIGVAPRLQGAGLGSLLLNRTLARVDAARAGAYLENSNPRNLKLYERAGFSVTREIVARRDAPPLFAMWRPAKARPDPRTRQGSRMMSQ
jgi:ribosomal protein S18 acetylase RimI-like enzyme